METRYRSYSPNQYSYVFDAVVEHYNEMQEADKSGWEFEDNQKFKYVIDCYRKEHNYTQAGICDLLQGLWLNLAFEYVEIEALLKGWGVEPNDRNVQNWWNVLASRILRLYNVIGINSKVQKLLTK